MTRTSPVVDFSVECSKIVLWLEKRGDKDGILCIQTLAWSKN